MINKNIKNKAMVEYLNNKVHHDSFKEAFYFSYIGGCGCGRNEELEELTMEIFITIGKEDGFQIISESLVNELIAQLFEKEGLTDHGGTVYGSRLTDEGKAIYEIYKNMCEYCGYHCSCKKSINKNNNVIQNR